MSSRRKVLWHVPGIGQMRYLKRDPTKLTFYLEGWHTNESRKNRGPWFYNIRARRVPTWWLEHMTRRVVEWANKHRDGGWYEIYGARVDLALDHLFAELSRRAPKLVVG